MKHLTIILLLFMFGCTSRHENPQQGSIVEQTDSIQPVDTLPLFKIKALEDTLYSFMSLADTIYNPFGHSKINFVFLDIRKKDTVVEFTMNLGLFLFMDHRDTTFSKTTYLVGACHVNGEDVVVYNMRLSSLKDIINEDLLSFKYAEEIDSLREDAPNRIPEDWDYIPPPPIWKYKLSGDSLIEVERCSKLQPYRRRGLSFK